MQVILKKDVAKVGQAGALVNVSDGYARNFLMARGLAVEATPGKIAEWKQEQAHKKASEAKQRAEAENVKKGIQGKAVKIEAKSGENGKLFGSITTAQVAEALSAQHGLNIDKRDIKLPDAVKQAGNYQFSVKLHQGISADMTLSVSASE